MSVSFDIDDIDFGPGVDDDDDDDGSLDAEVTFSPSGALFSVLERSVASELSQSADSVFQAALDSYRRKVGLAAAKTRGLYLRGLTMKQPNGAYERFAEHRENLLAQKRALEQSVSRSRIAYERLVREQTPEKIQMILREVSSSEPPQVARPPSVVVELNRAWKAGIVQVFNQLASDFQNSTERALTASLGDAADADEVSRLAEGFVRQVAYPVIMRYLEALQHADFQDMPISADFMRANAPAYWEAAFTHLSGGAVVETPELAFYGAVLQQNAFGAESPLGDSGVFKWFAEWRDAFSAQLAAADPTRPTQRDTAVMAQIKDRLITPFVRQGALEPMSMAKMLGKFRTNAEMGVLYARLSIVGDREAINNQLALYLRTDSTIEDDAAYPHIVYYYPYNGRDADLESVVAALGNNVNGDRLAILRAALRRAASGLAETRYALNQPIERLPEAELERQKRTLLQFTEEIDPRAARVNSQKLRALFNIDAKNVEIGRQIDEVDYILQHTAQQRDVPLVVRHRRPCGTVVPLEVEVATLNKNNPKALRALQEASVKSVEFTWFYLSDMTPVVTGPRVIKTQVADSLASALVLTDSSLRPGQYYATARVEFADGEQRTLTSVRATVIVEDYCVRTERWYIVGPPVFGEAEWVAHPEDAAIRAERRELATTVAFDANDSGDGFGGDDAVLRMGTRGKEGRRTHFSYEKILERIADRTIRAAAGANPNAVNYTTQDAANAFLVQRIVQTNIVPRLASAAASGTALYLSRLPVRDVVLVMSQVNSDVIAIDDKERRYFERLGHRLQRFVQIYADATDGNRLDSLEFVDDAAQRFVPDVAEIARETTARAVSRVGSMTYIEIASSMAWSNVALGGLDERLRRDFFVDTDTLDEFEARLAEVRAYANERYMSRYEVEQRGGTDREIMLADLQVAYVREQPLGLPMVAWERGRCVTQETLGGCRGRWRGYHSKADKQPTLAFVSDTGEYQRASERVGTKFNLQSFHEAVTDLLRDYRKTGNPIKLIEAQNLARNINAISLLAPDAKLGEQQLDYDEVKRFLPGEA